MQKFCGSSVPRNSVLTQETHPYNTAHSSTPAWKIPWTEEPGRLQSMGSLRVRHDWVTSHSLFTFMHWRRKWQPTPVFLPGESQGRGAWWAAIYGVTQSRTRLKWISSSSSSSSTLWLFDEYEVNVILEPGEQRQYLLIVISCMSQLW